jgi:hypothetical protein
MASIITLQDKYSVKPLMKRKSLRYNLFNAIEPSALTELNATIEHKYRNEKRIMEKKYDGNLYIKKQPKSELVEDVDVDEEILMEAALEQLKTLNKEIKNLHTRVSDSVQRIEKLEEENGRYHGIDKGDHDINF